MFRVAVCILIVLTGASFKPIDQINQKPGNDSEGLLIQIKAARQQLEKERVNLIEGVVGQRRVRTGRRSFKSVPVMGIVGREMALAISDPEGRINVVRAIKNDNGLEVLSPGFVLHMRKENGINSDIACINPSGGRVLAVKYPISNEGRRFGDVGPVIEAIYTPYSAEINNREVIREGIETIDRFIDAAYSRLSERYVPSRAFPGRKISEVIPKDVVRVLLMNEHIDPGEFKSHGLTRGLVERVLAIVATNKEKAYAYSISSAGARGLVQMISSTYSLLLNRYTGAGLNTNFVSGMADPVNAVMAQVLLCDADWQAIKTYSEIPVEKVGPYLAAAYNGGVGRVLTILREEEMDWMEDPDLARRPTMTVSKRVPVKVRGRRGKTKTKYVLKSYSRPIFRSETSKYVSQYHWINDFFIADKNQDFKDKERVR